MSFQLRMKIHGGPGGSSLSQKPYYMGKLINVDKVNIYAETEIEIDINIKILVYIQYMTLISQN